MNRRRELTLQRVSRIGGISAVESIPQNTKTRNRDNDAPARLTIEAALGTYMMKNDEVYNVPYQDTYASGYGNSGGNEQQQLSRQMDEYMSSLEESRLANAKSQLGGRRAAGQVNIRKFEEALANDPSAQYQLSRYRKNNNKSDFDALDANRCSGFLLYSYDKNGVHSVLGEHLAFGSYGGAAKSSAV